MIMPIELRLKKRIVREVYGIIDVREYFVSGGKKPLKYGTYYVNLATNSSCGSSFSAMRKVKFGIVSLKFSMH